LKIEDCKLKIYGCRSRSAGACAACRSVFFKIDAPKADLKYSIEDIQLLQVSENIPILFFWHKMHDINF